MTHGTIRRNKNGIIRKLDIRRMAKVKKQRDVIKIKLRQKGYSKGYQHSRTHKPDESYGENSQQADMCREMYEEEEKEFLKSLKKTDEQISEIERRMADQNEDGEWMEQRRKLITVSNFGKICKLKKTTNTAGTIKSILYNVISTKIPSLNHGKIHEIDAKNELGKNLTEEYNDNIEIISCGLFIDKSVYFLGASPDGFVEKIDSLVEIKCSYTAYKQNLTPDEAIMKKLIPFWKIKNDGNYEINTNHDWYYQIQGQLHITNKKNVYWQCGQKKTN
jgi:hypothetical protein